MSLLFLHLRKFIFDCRLFAYSHSFLVGEKKTMKKFSFIHNIVLVFGLTGILSLPVWSQSFKATLVGQVTDSTGAVVPNATVKLKKEGTETTQTVTTDGEGNFTITQIEPGRYELTTEAANFRRNLQTGLVLETNQTARVNTLLEAGNVAETVTVTAEPSVINTENSSKGEVITERQVQDLPLNGRNFTDLILLAPGIYRQPDSSDQGLGVSASGTRTDSSNYILDGVTTRSDRVGGTGVQTSIDNIQEFKVQTSTYSAEFGRTAGAQINVVTKGGTNNFHGSVFEYVRNDAFDAKNALAFDIPNTPVDESRKILRRNQFGFTLGGPLPFFNFGEGGPIFESGKDKTFFFTSFERQLEKRSSVVSNQVAPNAAWLRGDFSGILGAGADLVRGTADDAVNSNRIFDPVTRQAFPNNIIPTARINPAAAAILAYVPAANIPGSVTGFYASGLNQADFDRFSIRGDRKFSPQNSAYVRYSRQKVETTNPFPSGVAYPGFGNISTSPGDSVSVSDTHIFSPNLVNEARFGYFKQFNNFRGENAGTNFNSQFGITGVDGGGIYDDFPNINIDGLPMFGARPNTPLIFTLKNFQFYDALNIVRGNHNIKLGADIVRSNFVQADINSLNGNFRFRGRNTNSPAANPNNLPALSVGFRSFADFLLGLPEQAARQVGTSPSNLTGYQYGFFVQNDWRVRPWLTLNLGLRYELQVPLKEENDNLATFVPSLGRVVCARDVFDENGAKICAREAGFSESLISTDKNNFAPRIGFALRPFSDDKTVIRGGAGIFYSLETFNSVRGQLTGSYPFSGTQQVNRVANDLNFTLTNAFPPNRATVSGINSPSGVATETRTPTVYQYNLTVERQIMRDLAFEIGYVGSQGRFLGRRYNINQPRFSFNNGVVTGVLPFPAYANIIFQDNSVNSNYNGLQTSLRRRSKGGLTLLVSYTFGKSIDTASSTSNSTLAAQNLPQNIYNYPSERALSDFDRRHQFSATFNYILPIGKGGYFLRNARGITQMLVGGWQINGIATALSGRPFTPQFPAQNGGGVQRPNLIGDPYANIPAGLEFNPAAFERPVATAENPGAFGNAGRNILTAPPFRTFDFSVIKNTRIFEKYTIQLRAEGFNVFNTPNFRVPAFTLSANNAGQLTETIGQGRELQFAIKFLF